MSSSQDLFSRLDRLNEIGAALSQERDIDKLLENILVNAKELTGADGGTIYSVSEDKRFLRFSIVRTDSLNIAFGGTTGKPISANFPDLPLYREDGSPNDSMVAASAAIHAHTINLADAYTAEGFDFSGTRWFDQCTGYRSQSFLTVPMKNHEGEVIGVLQLINAIDPASRVVTIFSDADQRLVESLASQAAVAITNRQLVLQLEELFESFVNLINIAIDEKSPYTGGHCQRVPMLTMALAEAANRTHDGPLAALKLNDNDFYELKIAALLHDCGKVTTPVHVVDKATKLQTIYDRIHTLDTRFEVVKRDAEIAALRAQLGGESAEQTQRALKAQLAQIEADRDFLRRANIGSEKMQEADRERVRQIAARYRWCDVAGHDSPFLTDEELENLTIVAGTLTASEREVINHHIVSTIKMLETLPWPKHLRHVPEFAGGHHERMDGKGYPRGLKRDEMSWQARIIGIADIFEALTAKDRPYKREMRLSEALRIMERFRDNGHIDPDLFEVCLREGVFLDYARKNLDPAQIDIALPERLTS